MFVYMHVCARVYIIAIYSIYVHWRRLVKTNVGKRATKILGEMVAITDEAIGVYQLLEGTCPAAPIVHVYSVHLVCTCIY